jgi:putative transposase
MCRVFEVSRSGYYAWRKRPWGKRAMEEFRIKLRIRVLFAESKERAGSPKIAKDLRKESWTVSTRRVKRLMREDGLCPRIRKKFRVTTDSKHDYPVAPNILDRQFTVSKPDVAWVSDITYLKVANRWMYLVVFIDLFSRMIVGWELSDTLHHGFVLNAFYKAFWRRKPGKGLLVHSDRGVQYACDAFRNVLKDYSCIQSMSRKGNCWDNAVAESFFHVLKSELGETFISKDHTYQELFQYIEIDYNRKRTHSTLGYFSPAQFEAMKKYA